MCTHGRFAQPYRGQASVTSVPIYHCLSSLETRSVTDPRLKLAVNTNQASLSWLHKKTGFTALHAHATNISMDV